MPKLWKTRQLDCAEWTATSYVVLRVEEQCGIVEMRAGSPSTALEEEKQRAGNSIKI